MQVTSGLRAILNQPLVYEAFQRFMGAHRRRFEFVSTYISEPGAGSVLDIGCGPGTIVPYLPSLRYVGYDIDAGYIEHAQQRYGDRGTFICREFDRNEAEGIEPVDLVLMRGLLHHVDDGLATQLIEDACTALRPGGRIVTIDPTFVDGQNPLARWLISKDRGQCVRAPEAYGELFAAAAGRAELNVIHRLWVPYTHCIVEFHKAGNENAGA